MDDTSVLEANSGGRVKFELGSVVRYIQMDGSISAPHVVDQERSDRKGHVLLKEAEGSRVIKVHHRRILPSEMDGKAVVIESQDKHWSLCSDDGTAIEVSPNDTEVTCPKCSKTFSLFWIGVKPMTEATKTVKEKAPKAAKADKAAPKPKAEKPPKAKKEPKEVKTPIVVNFDDIVKHQNVELWTKKNVKFDHARIDVQAHTVLYTGESPRKLCFNTYNGALGKKASELPIDAFVANEAAKGAKAPWYPVADIAKTRAEMTSDGYEQYSK